MIRINNKRWDQVRGTDIRKLLTGADDENFFFEFKADEESPEKLMKEVSAFANTFGGYILIGVDNQKRITGCTRWTEQRIHTCIHDSITPIPNFDVRRFRIDKKTVYVIRIEEGSFPPYITGKGQIFERVSSGSFPIKDSAKLMHLYRKHRDQLSLVRDKIELPPLSADSHFPDNLCAYLDIGFAAFCSEETVLQKEFYTFDLEPIAVMLREHGLDFSISRVGLSILFSFNKITLSDGNGRSYTPPSGLHQFLEVMYDGSIRSRILLQATPNTNRVNIGNVMELLYISKQIYTRIFGDAFSKIHVYSRKYEYLHVIKQFTPFFSYTGGDPSLVDYFNSCYEKHCAKYGGNLILISSRVPKVEYDVIDRRYLQAIGAPYDAPNLVDALFFSEHSLMGFIDRLKEE